MEQKVAWSCLVDKQGKVIEWEDKAGASYIENLEQVKQYAQALIYSKQDNLNFYYQYDTVNWLWIDLHRYQQKFTLIYVEKTALPYELSKRELDILTLLSSGLSNIEIAEKLHISERTVAKHIEHLFAKTATDNRTLLAVFALNNGLYCLPSPSILDNAILPSSEIEKIAESLSQPTSTPFFIKTKHTRPIVIGVPYVEAGIGEIDTQELLNGTRLAAEMLNQNGGVGGRKVQITTAGFYVEDKKSIERAYRQLFEQDVDAISANYACYSADIHELVASQGIPYLHIATHSGSDKLAKNLASQSMDNIFQVCASDINYGAGVTRFLQSYQACYPELVKQRRLLLINVKWQPIDIGVDNLIWVLRKSNWHVDVIELDQSNDPFHYAVQQIHHIEPAIIVFVSYFAEDIVNFYQKFQQSPINSVIYSIYAPSVFLPDNQICEGVLWSTTTGLSRNYMGQKFCQEYQQFFGRQPSYSQASVAYDQVQILANSWQHCVSPRHFKQVLNGIRSLPYHGVNGAYYFGTKSQIGLTYPDNTKDLSISQPHLLFQVQQGKSKVIAPSLFAETSFKLPTWFHVKL